MNVRNILNRGLGLVTVPNLQKVINSLFTTTHSALSATAVESTTLDTGRATVGQLTLSATLTEGTAALSLKAKSATVEFAGGATEVIPVAVPANCVIVGAQIRNNTLLTATTGVSYSAAYSGGSTQSIGTGIAFTKNTKTNTFFTVQGAGEVTNITSNTTNITLTPNAGTLDTGTVEAVVYYYEFTTPTSVA